MVTDSRVDQNDSYDPAATFAQTSATTVAASRIAALPVSVRRNWRSGVSRFRAHAVRPDRVEGAGSDSVMPGFSQERGRWSRGAQPSGPPAISSSSSSVT